MNKTYKCRECHCIVKLRGYSWVSTNDGVNWCRARPLVNNHRQAHIPVLLSFELSHVNLPELRGVGIPDEVLDAVKTINDWYSSLGREPSLDKSRGSESSTL